MINPCPCWDFKNEFLYSCTRINCLETETVALAIFDLDNTLLAGDSDYLWGEFLCDRGIVDGDHYQQKNREFYTAYQQGTMNILEFLEFALKPLSLHPMEQLQTWHREYMNEIISPLIRDNALALVEKHRQKGDTLLVITATNSFVTAPIVERFGIDNLIATEPEIVDGAYTGAVAGTPSFQHGKVERLDSWLVDNNETLEDSWFYSDSHNDLPLLKLVTHPVAVDPDDELRSHAEQHGWPILHLHK